MNHHFTGRIDAGIKFGSAAGIGKYLIVGIGEGSVHIDAVPILVAVGLVVLVSGLRDIRRVIIDPGTSPHRQSRNGRLRHAIRRLLSKFRQ